MDNSSRPISNSNPADVKDRAFVFAVRIMKLCRILEQNSLIAKSVCNQLLRAGTSIGANLEEAVAGQSTADFLHKNGISLKEAREANYWLRLILASTEFQPKIKTGIEELEQEAMEIAKIIGKRIVTTKNRS
jgi:four helix bundle protein